MSGLNTGYEFTTLRTDCREQSIEELEVAIRRFLADIDPESGYLVE